ncbi:ubiquinone/menaquinone biosynthesis methyltransferase [Acidipila sp. EB88]|uniref:ubiquinone/menaquinone biosynthesis methyltransferase n=1 Tax=Acidipila sp. EB88 TaxID=2305226 RepID=UPI003516D3E8
MSGAKSNTGARPQGAASEQDAAAAVQAMFDAIAPRYDLLNHVLSLNIDRLWWWRTARRFRTVLRRGDARVLDLCCGTGDMTMALLRHRPKGAVPVLAADFSHGMLVRGARKFTRHGAVAIEADAMQLPLADGSLDLLTTAFGFRNLRNYQAGLAEFYRVLAPGGQLGILDFAEPGGLLGALYRFYFRHVLPRIGTRISGASGPYAYLPASVGGFPAPPALMQQMREIGFGEVTWTRYSFGIAGLYVARKPRA